MSAVSEAIEGATGPVKKLVKKQSGGIGNKIGYAAGLLILFLIVIRFRSQIVGLLGKIPVLGALLTNISGPV